LVEGSSAPLKNFPKIPFLNWGGAIDWRLGSLLALYLNVTGINSFAGLFYILFSRLK